MMSSEIEPRIAGREPAQSWGYETNTDVRTSLFELEHAARLRLELGAASDRNWFDQNSRVLLSDCCESEPQLHVEVLLLFVQWYFKEGRSDAAFDVAGKAVQVATRAGIPALLRRSLNLLGVVHSRMGNLLDASICYVEALRIAEQIGDRVGKAATLANLSDLRFNAGLLAESIVLNRYVIELAAGEPHLAQIAAGAHHNVAVASLALDDLHTAHREITVASQLASEPKTKFWAHQRVIFEATYAKILIRLGCLTEAKERVCLAQKYADYVASDPARLHAGLAQALWDAAAGEPEQGLFHLESLRHLVRVTDPSYRDFLEAELTCNSHAGRHACAEGYRQKYLLDLAQFQRHSAIQQIAALQRSFRTDGTAPEAELLALPRSVRERVMSPSTRRPGGDRVTRQLEALACLADLRDDAGSEHSYRVGRLAFLLAIDLGQDHETAASLEFAARLHDVGNLAVPDVLLLKHGKLVGKELDIMRRHTTEGCKMLTDILGTVEREKRAAMHTRVESLRVAAEIALHHHEWWDGSGYPRCIRGGAIPEPARIVALVDAFDVLVHARPYKTACSIDDALAEISSLSGRQFEPRICNAFVTLLRKLQRGGTDVLARIEPLDCRLSPYAAANRAIERIVESARAPASPKAASRMEKWPAGV